MSEWIVITRYVTCSVRTWTVHVTFPRLHYSHVTSPATTQVVLVRHDEVVVITSA